MLDILVKRDLLREVVHVPVNHDTDISALFGLFEYLLVASLPSADDRSEQLDPALFRHLHDPVYHLVHRLLLDHAPAVRAVGNTDPCIEQTQIIVNLRDCSYRGARVPVGRFLIDRNGGRQTFNALHIRLLHLTEELSRVGRQRFHISPLPFGVNRIKCQRALAGPRKAGQYDQFIAGDVDAEVSEIIYICTAYADKFHISHKI